MKTTKMKTFIPILLILFLPILSHAQPGTIDSMWGTDGQVYQDILSGGDNIQDAVLLSNGKMIVCGTAQRAALNTQLLVAQFNSDGSLDNSFGNGGYFLGDFPVQTAANALGLADDGTIFAAGRYGTSADPQMFVVKLKPNGTLDSTFNFIGYDQVTFGANTNGEVNDIYVYPGNNQPFLLAGQVDDGTDPDMAIVKLFANGNPDVTFGTNAARIIDFRASDNANAIAVANNLQGDIFVAGSSVENNSSDFDMAIARLNSNGSSDNAFSNDGRAFVSIGTGNSTANDILITSNNQMVLGGYGFDSITGGQARALAVVEPDGSMYTPFNGTGMLTLSSGVNDFLVGNSLALTPTGDLLIAGRGGPFGTYNFCLYRLNMTGQLDNSFGNNGMFQAYLGTTGNNSCNKVLMLPNNKIMLFGSAIRQGSSDLTMLRLNNDFSSSIAELPGVDEIKIYPNPVTSGIVNFEFEINKEGTAQLFNSLGELVTVSDLSSGSNHSLYLSADLSSGNYVLQILEEGVIRATGQILVD
jgi:uncharacterized delta-60 repeat protein